MPALKKKSINTVILFFIHLIANSNLTMADGINYTWVWEKESIAKFMPKDHSRWTYQPDNYGFSMDDIPER